ncbi:MAG TPA: non-homologous end-joining DNA ligase [Fimbriimonadaceae bacterium]|nr:non-homologous end-joining DNA ligase [Fimbriimonadaceae bacterium]
MLEEYRQKRDFTKTNEPPPEPETEGKGPLRFVIQKHDATRLHYDFRLEADGVLKSWAVPKGPSRLIGEKRAAIQTEDHPLDYASFEGVIPKGSYGAGEVIVWDEGIYSPDEDGPVDFQDRELAERRLLDGLAKGKISVYLKGHKIKGSYALVKIKGKDKKDDTWIMLKHRDEYAVEKPEDDTLLEDERSVLTGRTLEDVRQGRSGQGRPEGPSPAARVPGARTMPMPNRLRPMMAQSSDKPFNRDGWHYELKFDGIRCIAILDQGRVTLWSRADNDVTHKFPALVEELAKLDVDQAVLDGEVVALDERMRPSFETMLRRFNLSRSEDIRRMDRMIPVTYMLFDVLHLSGYDLRHAALRDRRALLEQMSVQSPRVQIADVFDDGEALFKGALALELEGIVAKKLDSRYLPGERSDCWLKIKSFNSDEFFICGYTKGEGSRGSSFGSLVLGKFVSSAPEGSGGEPVLAYCGNVGSGFDEKKLDEVMTQLQPFERKTSPFPRKIEAGKVSCWFEPVVACEVKYAHYTQQGILRAPVFLRLRPDVTPEEALRQLANPQEPEEVPEEMRAQPSTSLTSSSSGPNHSGEEGGVREEVLRQLEGDSKEILLKVEGYEIGITNADKVYWPAHEGSPPVTKRDLLRYYATVAPYILPHLKDRPLTLHRMPEGIHGQRFYQKHWDGKNPPFVQTLQIYSEHNKRASDYMVVNNLATLLWLAQVGDLELHTWYSRISLGPDAPNLGTDFSTSVETLEESVLNYPDFMAVDLDPYIYSGQEKKGEEPEYNIKAFRKGAEIALEVKAILDQLGLRGYLKTSGKTGLHLFIPIVRDMDYDEVRAMAGTIGSFVLRKRPKEVTMEWATEKRTGKIFFDHNMNTRGKTLASIYSTRAANGCPVSIPVSWDELESIVPSDWTIRTVPDRLRVKGDLWYDILDSKQDLKDLLSG